MEGILDWSLKRVWNSMRWVWKVPTVAESWSAWAAVLVGIDDESQWDSMEWVVVMGESKSKAVYWRERERERENERRSLFVWLNVDRDEY